MPCRHCPKGLPHVRFSHTSGHRDSVTEIASPSLLKTHWPEIFHCVGDCHCAELEHFHNCTTCNKKFVSSHILTWCLGSYKRSARLRSLPAAKRNAARGALLPHCAVRKQMGGRWGEESKAIANQTSLGSGPKFGAARWTYSLQYHFFGRSLSRFLIGNSHSAVQKSAQKKNIKRDQTSHTRRDLSSIWRLPGLTLRTRKRLCSRETAQTGDPDRTL